MKAIYRHEASGDLFAIDTDSAGNVVSTCGPLLFKDLDPAILDYDGYWNAEISAKLGEFERVNREEYRDLLVKNGFVIASTQRHLF